MILEVFNSHSNLHPKRFDADTFAFDLPPEVPQQMGACLAGAFRAGYTSFNLRIRLDYRHGEIPSSNCGVGTA